MADIEVRRRHDFGLPQARHAADEMVAHLGREFDLKGRWTGDTLHFERPGVNGTLAVTDKDLHLSVTLGFLLRMMKPAIEGAVMRELDALFARKRPATGRANPPTDSPKVKKGPAARKKSG